MSGVWCDLRIVVGFWGVMVRGGCDVGSCGWRRIFGNDGDVWFGGGEMFVFLGVMNVCRCVYDSCGYWCVGWGGCCYIGFWCGLCLIM